MRMRPPKSKQTAESQLRGFLRGATTRATTKITSTGRVRGKDYIGDKGPRPVTLPKMPWDKTEEQA